jgi:hypothetical protein
MTTRLLGKKRAVYSPKSLRLANYLDYAALPPLPDEHNQYGAVSRFDILGNGKYGCCVEVAIAHCIQTWTANAAREFMPTEKQVVKTYFERTGGEDSGLVVLDELTNWRKIGRWGHPMSVFAYLNPRSDREVKYAIYLFGGAVMGLSLPNYIADAETWGRPGPDVSDDDAEPGSWGGHAVHLGGYKSSSYFTSTWDQIIKMTDWFKDKYADECYVCLSLDWFTKDHQTPEGFAWKDLQADLARITK